MSFKPTIIGTVKTESGSAPTPTRLDGSDSVGVQPAPAMRPTAFKPTTMAGAPAATPSAAPENTKPAALTQVTAGALAATPPAPVKASVLPGVQRKPLEVTFEALAARFPGMAPAALERTKAVLAGVSPQSMDASAWMHYGIPAQEVLAGLVKERLALMQGSSAQSVATHLARLQTLLQEVLEAMGGGFLKRSASKVWESVSGEVRQLEGLLSQAAPGLTGVMDSMTAIGKKVRASGDDLLAHSLAADFICDHVEDAVVNLLVGRITSLGTSQALVLEQVQMLTLDSERVQELMKLVQDGVLLQLPAIYSQLAGLSAKPSDTQRFLATEKLNEIVQFIQRKI